MHLLTHFCVVFCDCFCFFEYFYGCYCSFCDNHEFDLQLDHHTVILMCLYCALGGNACIGHCARDVIVTNAWFAHAANRICSWSERARVRARGVRVFYSCSSCVRDFLVLMVCVVLCVLARKNARGLLLLEVLMICSCSWCVWCDRDLCPRGVCVCVKCS